MCDQTSQPASAEKNIKQEKIIEFTQYFNF